MRTPRWLAGGAHTPTAVGTFISLVAAPLGGLGFLALALGAWLAGTVMTGSAVALWLGGKALIDR